MGEKTNISWADSTWNTVVGCSHVSPGCEHCFAESLALRYGWSKHPWGAQWAAENVVLKPHKLDLPLRWKEPKRIFVNSLSDVFHEQIPDEYIDKMFAVMKLAYWHTFMILTKRPERMLRWFSERVDLSTTTVPRLRVAFATEEYPKELVRAIRHHAAGDDGYVERGDFVGLWPLSNVWLGVSVEDQRRADERIPILLETPAAIRFLSCEPLLGPIDLTRLDDGDNALTGTWTHYDDETGDPCEHDDGDPGINWCIVGGESGKDHRPMDLDWARRLRDDCVNAGVKYFYKQGSGPRPGMNPTLDGVEWHQFPDTPSPTSGRADPRDGTLRLPV